MLITWTLAPKSKKHRKKKPVSRLNTNGATENANGNVPEIDDNLEGEEHQEPETPIDGVHQQEFASETLQNGTKSPIVNGSFTRLPGASNREIPLQENSIPTARSPRLESRRATMTKELPNEAGHFHNQEDTDTEARLDALARERATLKDEVAGLRKSLEEIQLKHNAELGTMKEQLEGTQGEKDHAESQYRTLLGKVNTIKSQLGERLKADAVRITIDRQ